MRRTSTARRLPIGAELQPGGVHFRVWTPRRRTVDVVLVDRSERIAIDLAREDGGYFSGAVPAAGPGTRYCFRLDGADRLLPDPASRFQPEGPHGPSEVIDPQAFRWTDESWNGLALPGQVIYELHIGTFTPEGTFAAATHQLDALRDLGVTVLEIMPVADFVGRYGWGYDGVNWFAPTRLYGSPDDLRRLVDCAHALGLGVILDVVYNHLGPDGNYLKEFALEYFTDSHATEWGEAINYDGPASEPVREFVLANVSYWIGEFHFDGLRLDATHSIFDRSPEHILRAIGRRARAAAGGRAVLLVAENEAQQICLIRPADQGGYGLDAAWNDDFHHSARVALTGRREAYYSDYAGTPQEIVSSLKRGFLYQGQRYAWQKKNRGTPAVGVHPAQFVHFLENHDQVANSFDGARGHTLTTPGRWRAMTAVLLLGPATPMLFQGQEFSASSPFLYFADHEPELAAAVRRGRAEFLSQFRSLVGVGVEQLPDPCDARSFGRSRLDPAERLRHPEAYALHRDLLRLRKHEPVFQSQRPGGVDGAVIGPEAAVLRFFAEIFGPDATMGDRLLILNLGPNIDVGSVSEPLLAPPEGARWDVLWSSEDPRYGGSGTPPLESEQGWHIPGHAAIVLKPVDGERHS